MRRSISILSILGLFISLQINAHNYYTRNFTMKDGMPSNSVRSILKDSNGYLWVGTDAGLCRFDGKNFKIYSSDEGFTGNKIWSMAEDGNHNMWFGDYGGGLWKFDGSEFSRYTIENGIVNNNVRSLYYSEKWKLLFIGTQFGLTIFDGNNFTNLNEENTLLDQDPYIMGFIEEEDVIYIYTFSNDNLAYYPQKKILAPQPDSLGFNKKAFISCFKKSDGTSLLMHRSGLIATNGTDTLLEIRKPTNAPFNKDIGQVFGLTEDRHQNIWLASWEPNPKNPGGLFLFDGEKIIRKNEILGKDPLSGWSVHFDKENNILWFGTLDMGLFMIQETPFEKIPANTYGIDDFNISDLAFDKNGNLIILDKKNLIITHSDKSFWKPSNKQLFEAYKKYLHKVGLEDKRAGDLLSFKKVLNFKEMTFQNDSILWVSSDPAIYKININRQSIECFSRAGYGDGFLLFNSSGQLCNVPYWGPYDIFKNIELSDERLNIKNIPVKPKDISNLIFIDDEVWMTSWSGGLYAGKDTIFRNFNQSNTTISNALNALCVDNNGHLIIGANNGEVYICKPQEDSLNVLYTIDSRDGILGNSISWLEVDRYDHLWIGTNTGLNQLDLNKLYNNDSTQIINFSEKEAYLAPNVNVSLKNDNGNIWLGTDESLVCMHIKNPNDKKPISKKLILQNFEINGIRITDGIKLLEDLKYDQNYLRFNFDVINFVNPEKDRFRYFLDGLDIDWSGFSDARHTTYPYLPPGKYTFRVEGKNLNTGAQYSPLKIEITIHLPFWRTWWFISIHIGVIIMLVWLYFKYLINETKQEERKKAQISKQIAELEMKALLAQMNPHFTFNAINSIQNYILDNDVDKALSYFSDFSKIIRQTLENASKEFITLDEDIEYIKRYLNLEQMRFDEQFSQEIKIDPEIDLETTLIPPMILQPYVENAIKHGLRHKKTNGKLSLGFSVINSNVLLCTIEDNGIGRAASEMINKIIQKDHNGAGMAITKNRIQKLKEVYKSDLYNVEIIDLIASNKNSNGTRVEICLPLIQSF